MYPHVCTPMYVPPTHQSPMNAQAVCRDPDLKILSFVIFVSNFTKTPSFLPVTA